MYKPKKPTTHVIQGRIIAASHLRLPQAAHAKRKLLPRFFGPYRVSRVISDVAYELELPKHFKIHPVIHISHLKANADGTKDFPDRPEYTAPPPPVVDEEGQDYFQVEAFRNHRQSGTRRQFLVKWLGYPESENMWISESNLRSDLGKIDFDNFVAEYVSRSNAKITRKK